MRIFSKEKFIEVEGYNVYLKCKDWVNECDKKNVVNGYIENDYISDKSWEKEVKNEEN